MNGIVTQTRSLSRELSCLVKITDGQTDRYQTLTAGIPGSQETTSYRSSSQEDSVYFDKNDTKVFQPPRFVVAKTDSGHEFQTTSTRLISTTHCSNVTVVDAYGRRFQYSGDAVITGPAAPYGAPPVSPMSLNDLIVLGGRAINATIPTAPEAGLSNLLGELKRDGLPALPSYHFIHSGSNISNLGGEYLNMVFGWEPLVSDLLRLLKSVKNSAEILRQFKRDSGRIVRRRFSFPEERTFEEKDVIAVNGANVLVFPFGSKASYGGMVKTSDTTQTNVWFAGAYSYYLDVGDELLSRAEEFEQKANHLLGTRLTPDVLYDLTPFSWLADWYVNVGTALSNVSALQEDGLVIRYGYLMRHTVTSRSVQSAPILRGWTKPFPISTLYRTERKERWKATPYGFGLELSGFSPKQWAILAALGMTKAPGVAK